MKRILSLVFSVFCAALFAAEAIPLPAPDLAGTGTLADALKARQSIRDFLPIAPENQKQVASNLLWSACGVNRENGKKVIPAALARYAVSVYFADDRGIYRFDAGKNELLPVSEGNFLTLCASNRTMCEKASCALLFVIDESVWAARGKGSYAALEAGAMMQNVYLYCAGAGLGTVACGSFDEAALSRALRLTAPQKLFLTMIVGALPR